MLLSRSFSRALLVLLAIGLAPAAAAHDPGLSSVELIARGSGIDARITLATNDVEPLVPIDRDHDGRVAPDELAAARAELEVLGRGALAVEIDGAPIEPARPTAEVDDSGGLQLLLRFEAASGQVILRAPLLSRLPRGHRQYVEVRDEAGRVLAQRLVRSGDDLLRFDLEARASAASSIGRFLALGIEHILTGYDHIAFLLALLIVSASFRSMLKIVTSFSVAHSITFVLAATDVVRLSPRIVEPLIAASIVYVGLENLFRRDFRRRTLLTFGFGLVHGLGFASALREAGVGAAGVGLVLPLASFNVGVELGQLAVVALVLPLVTRLARNETRVRCVPACSTLLALAGATWLVARVL